MTHARTAPRPARRPMANSNALRGPTDFMTTDFMRSRGGRYVVETRRRSAREGSGGAVGVEGLAAAVLPS